VRWLACASLLIENGESLAYVRDPLGRRVPDGSTSGTPTIPGSACAFGVRLAHLDPDVSAGQDAASSDAWALPNSGSCRDPRQSVERTAAGPGTMVAAAIAYRPTIFNMCSG
jgi:hypothetical protein